MKTDRLKIRPQNSGVSYILLNIFCCPCKVNMTVELLNMVTLKSVYRKMLASDNFAMIKTKRNTL